MSRYNRKKEKTLQDIREIIANRAVNHIKDCEEQDITTYLVFQSFTGSGKTHTVMKEVDKAGYTWIYSAPFHDVIRENLQYSKLRNYSFVHLKGKEQEGVCFSKEYRKYAKMGLSITPFCESRCPYRHNGCPYYETKNLIEGFPHSWAGVHAHIPTYLQTFLYNIEYNNKMMYESYDVIIIDEFPTQSLFNQVIIQRRDIDLLREVISYMEEDSSEKEFIQLFLDELTLASGKISINYTKLKSFLRNHRGLNLKEFLQYYKIILLDLVSHKTIKKPPKNILFNLALVYQENPEIEQLQWMIYKHTYDGWTQLGIYITTSNINYFKNLPIPVIALDATAEIKAWNTLLNDKCESVKIDMEYKNLYQMRSRGRYPVSTWIKFEKNKKIISESGIRLCKLIANICKRKKHNVLLCSNKRIKNLIETYLKKNYKKSNYKFAIYYNLRSRNEYYETCDTCIITHEPNIPPLQLKIMTNVIGWELELLNELMRKAEMKQGIGRIRQNIFVTENGRKRKKIEVYVLPGTLVSENKLLPEAKLINYESMYVGELISVRDVLVDTIRRVGKTSFNSLRQVTREYCSQKILKEELKNLFIGDYIDSYDGVIKWTFTKEKHRKIKYKVNDK